MKEIQFIEIGNTGNSTLASTDTNNLVFKPMETLKFEFQSPASLFDLKLQYVTHMEIHCLSLMTILQD